MKPSQIGATLQLGKSGVTPKWLEELRDQVKKRKLVKVRLLRSSKTAAGPKEVAGQIAAQAGVRVLDVRGSVAVFGRGSAEKKKPSTDPGTVK